jgi:hypothetical protein
MRDFGSWFSEQGKGETEEIDDTIWLECHCGKWETVSRAAFENGDTGWYSEDPDSGKGLCGGSQFCTP